MAVSSGTPTPTPTATPASPYAGTWELTHTPTSIINTACDPNPVGVPQVGPVFTIDNSGQFLIDGGANNTTISGSGRSFRRIMVRDTCREHWLHVPGYGIRHLLKHDFLLRHIFVQRQ